MFQIKSAIILNNENKGKSVKIDKENFSMDINAGKKKFPKKKFVIWVIIIGIAIGLYQNIDETKKILRNLNIEIPNEVPFLADDNSSNLKDKFELSEANMPEVLLKRREQIQEKKEESSITNETNISPNKNLDSAKIGNENVSNEISNKKEEVILAPINIDVEKEQYPVVNIPNKTSSLSDEIKQDDTVIQTNNNDKETKQNSEVMEEPSQEDKEIQILQRELAMLLKNSEFSIKTEKENVLVFINNIKHSIGDHILNSKKFFLNDMQVICKEGQLPVINVQIGNKNKNKVLFEKEIAYSTGKKIIISFDSVSVNNLQTKQEEIYLPGEVLFKNFKLDEIIEKDNMLNVKFTCNQENILISGKELSEIK